MHVQGELPREFEPTGGLKVDVLRDEARLAALRPEWDALFESSRASVFNAWQWLYPWYRRFGEGRQPMVLTARDAEGALVGLLSLYRDVRRSMGLAVRRLGLMGDERVGSDHLDALALPGAEEMVARAFASGLLRLRGEWDVLELLDLDEEGTVLSRVVDELRTAKLGAERRPRFDCPYERFEPGLSFDAFLSRTARADNYQRRRRWLKKQPGFSIEAVDGGERLSPSLEAFLELHGMRWQEASQVNDAEVQAFHREAVPLLAGRGRLRLYTLRVGGRPVASVYGLRHRAVFSYFNAGYDPKWRSKSVGLVLVGETFRDVLQSGFSEYDFLRGTEPYKADWTTRVRRTVGLRVWGGGVGAWVAHGERLGEGARNAVRAMLPASALDRLRRLRRGLARPPTAGGRFDAAQAPEVPDDPR